MKTETILKTDVLDIIFQNKNKEYGAYQLRKYYPNRLKKSIAITTLLVLVFAGLQSWKTPIKTTAIYVSDVIEIANIKPPIKEEKIIKKEQQFAKQNNKKIANTVPVIVKDSIKTTVPNLIDDTTKTGLTNVLVGTGLGKKNNVVVENPGTDTTINNGSNNGGGEDEPIITNPSTMPEFAGGIEALQYFMLRNLAQPDDIEAGEKITILVKFIVDKNGHIYNPAIIKSGREDLDIEVIRVVNKMPTWKPGLQNGFAVAVYFTMPITFANNN
jgi:periplasmic protein TonB